MCRVAMFWRLHKLGHIAIINDRARAHTCGRRVVEMLVLLCGGILTISERVKHDRHTG